MFQSSSVEAHDPKWQGNGWAYWLPEWMTIKLSSSSQNLDKCARDGRPELQLRPSAVFVPAYILSKLIPLFLLNASISLSYYRSSYSHARVFWKALVHEFHILYSHI